MIAMLVFDCAVVGFAGVKPLNITFTMARPLPIYPLKVPSYLLLPQAPGGVPLSVERLRSLTGGDPQSSPPSCGHHLVCAPARHYIRATAHFFFSSGGWPGRSRPLPRPRLR